MAPPRYTAPQWQRQSAAAGPSTASSRDGIPVTRRSSLRDADASKAETSGAGAEDDIEDFGPPDWRTVLNNRADLGYPDFYPSRPGFGQSEDVLTEENVKNGYVAKTFVAVGAESFSMHGPIHQHLMTGGLDLLMKLGKEILEKRDEAMPQFGERSFRIPPRVTYNETKRLQFLADLANPSIPLHRLMRDRVPHGFKGAELLDTMFAPPPPPQTAATKVTANSSPPNPIPVDRALWFIRVLGANEITAHRSRVQAAPASAPATASAAAAAASPLAATPSSNPASSSTLPAVTLSSNDWYTQEFTTTFTSWLRAQLNQLVLPTSQAKVAASTKAPVGVLGDEKARARWAVKWEYSCKLLERLHSHRLTSTALMLSWLSDLLAVANLAQIGFIAQLIGQHVNDMHHHTSIGRRCVRGLCEKIKEIRSSPAASSLVRVETMLKHLIKVLFIGNAAILISPHTWRAHHDLLREICCDGIMAETSRTSMEDIARRNETLLFKTVASSTASPRRNHIEEVAKLDSVSYETNMNELCRSFFDGGSSANSPSLDLEKFQDKVCILLDWAMGLSQLGIHRPYACHTMLRLWVEHREEYLSRSPRARPVDIFPQLYAWLDKDPAARRDRAQAIGITFGEFTRQGMFSYSRYLQTLIARGLTARSNGPRSHHMDVLRAIPIFVEAQDLLQQRRIALSGDNPEVKRRDDEAELQAMEAFKMDCKEYVPELYGLKEFGRSGEFKDQVDHAMPSTAGITRFMFLQARFELYAEAEKRLKRQGKIPAMGPSTFARVIHILHLCKGYSSIADFIVRGLRLNDNREILRIIIDTLRRHADVWTAMDRWPRIVDALMERFHKLDRRQIYHPRLPRLLLDLAVVGRVKEEDVEDVQGYIDDHDKEWHESLPSPSDAKSSMPGLRKAIVAGDSELSTKLGKALYEQHGAFAGWADTWWSTIVDALKSQNLANETAAALLLAVGAHVDQICAFRGFTIDVVVGRWLDCLSPLIRLDILTAVCPIRQLFLILVTRRRLSTHILLDKLCFGIWKQASAAAILPKPRITPGLVQAVDSTVVLVQQLLLTKPPNTQIPPLDHQESLIAQTSRAEAFNNHNIQDLIRHLPLLVVLCSSPNIPEKTRSQIDLFFRDFATIPEFKTAAFRHLGLLKDSFLSGEWTKPGIDPAIESGMIQTLKAIMSDGPSASASLPSFGSGASLSAWKWTSVILEMRVEFKRLALRIENNDNAAEARQTLHQLVSDSLSRESSADDADLLCETFRGIDPAVKTEILACGMDRLTSVLVDLEVQDIQIVDGKVDVILRVIDSAGSDDAVSTQPSLVSARQRLLEQIATSMIALESQVSAGVESDTDDPGLGDGLPVILKILKFVIAIRVQEGAIQQPARPDVPLIVGALFRLMIALREIQSLLLRYLHDLLVYVIDSTPLSGRAAINSVLVTEAASNASAVLTSPLLASLLPYQAPDLPHLALTSAPGQSGTAAESAVPFDDRPWELFEYLAPIPGKRSHGDEFLASRVIRDTASLPMSLFSARPKRDALPGRAPEPARDRSEESDAESELDWHNYASERNLGDGLAGEPMAAKQIASLLFAGPDDIAVEDMLGSGGKAADASVDMATSPATSVSAVSQLARPRRMSTRIATNARIQAGTNLDPIPIDEDDEDDDGDKDDDDSDKDSDDDDDDDDIEEVPPAKRQRVGGKTVMGRATMGGKGPARKTVGGKAPGRKTVGGKAPARKTVGGKTTGGKAMKSVRR